MEEDIQQQIINRLGELPVDVRAAIESADTSARVQAVGAKHGLHVDQIGLLEDAVMLVLLGFVNPGDFTRDIGEQLSLPAKDAATIAEEISEAVFVPVHESMQAFMEQKAAEAKNTAAPSAPAAATAPEKHELPIPVAPQKPPLPTTPAATQMLTQKTVSTPTSYKTDPYREPPE